MVTFQPHGTVTGCARQDRPGTMTVAPDPQIRGRIPCVIVFLASLGLDGRGLPGSRQIYFFGLRQPAVEKT